MSSTLALLARVEQAYRSEAALLDAGDLAAWLEWLHPDFRYEVPIPVTREGAGARGYSTRGLLAVETRPTIELWARRLSEDHIATAYAENAPNRTRHFVTNVQVEPTDNAAELRVVSNILLSWNWRGQPPAFATAQRCDVLVDDGDDLILRDRRILLDCDVVHLNHLRVIF
ncbi:hypothetical protein BH10ACT9_BH10ACT9_08130 [soil metagenome]